MDSTGYQPLATKWMEINWGQSHRRQANTGPNILDIAGEYQDLVQVSMKNIGTDLLEEVHYLRGLILLLRYPVSYLGSTIPTQLLPADVTAYEEQLSPTSLKRKYYALNYRVILIFAKTIFRPSYFSKWNSTRA